MSTRAAPGGGRVVEVEPERLAGWFSRFADRHDGVSRTAVSGLAVEVFAVDGARALVAVPFSGWDIAPVEHDGLDLAGLLGYLTRPRRIGLVLVRLGGHSVGICADGRVLVSATGSRPVHGRNRAGGSSAQRFARRREGQARVARQAAADTVARVLVPVADTLDAVVLGGDGHALAQLRADVRLAALLARAEPRVLDVPEPRRAVLDLAARRARCVEIVVRDPPAQPAPPERR